MSASSGSTRVAPYKRAVYFCDDLNEARRVANEELRKGEKPSVVNVSTSRWSIGYEIRTISKYAVVVW